MTKSGSVVLCFASASVRTSAVAFGSDPRLTGDEYSIESKADLESGWHVPFGLEDSRKGVGAIDLEHRRTTDSSMSDGFFWLTVAVPLAHDHTVNTRLY